MSPSIPPDPSKLRIGILSANPRSYSIRRLVEAGRARGHRMHVLVPGSDPSLMPTSIDVPWTEIARASGGGCFGCSEVGYVLPGGGPVVANNTLYIMDDEGRISAWR